MCSETQLGVELYLFVHTLHGVAAISESLPGLSKLGAHSAGAQLILPTYKGRNK